jgi:hypothetical protein
MNKIIVALGLLMLPVCGFADVQCPAAGEDGALGKTVAMIKAAKSCYDADQIATQCAWGSSADVEIAGAAGDICANAFRGKLTAVDKKAYLTLIHKCQIKYANIQGTMYISAEAFCEESVGKLLSDLYSPVN